MRRLSIQIEDEQFNELNKLVPWGSKRALFNAIIDDLIKALKKNPSVILAAIITKQLTIEKWSSITDNTGEKS